MFLARKISLAKWERPSGWPPGEIRSDAITADLRTVDNSLSLWECGCANDAELDDVVLALASALDHVSTVDIVWFHKSELQSACLQYKKTDGNTNVTELKGKHIDVYELDYTRLGKVAHFIPAAKKNNQYRRYKKEKVIRLLSEAVKKERVQINALGEGVKKKVREFLGDGEK